MMPHSDPGLPRLRAPSFLRPKWLPIDNPNTEVSIITRPPPPALLLPMWLPVSPRALTQFHPRVENGRAVESPDFVGAAMVGNKLLG